MDDLLEEFIAETRETAEALAGEIVAWESAPHDRARLDAIFRFVHTVKGSCGFLDLPRLERLAHAAEDALAQVRSGERQPNPALVSAVLAIVDRIGEIVDAIEGGVSLGDGGEELLIAALAPGADMGDALVAQPATTSVTRVASRSVRLGVDLLDRMMSGMSDMVLARNELARRLRTTAADPAIEASLERLSATIADMRETVTRTRMQRIDSLFSALPRVVRDTATSLNKQVALTIEGADVELDREMIELMRDPLVHMIRNAIDHGIEGPLDRRAAGKPEQGRLTVAARQSGNQIVIEIADDGRGIDVSRVIAKLVAGGRDERTLLALGEREKLGLIFEPGLTTKDAASAISGRGVGMDVVREAISQIGGRIALENEPGRGLRITIHVPLTLSIISTIIVSAAGQSFAIPRGVIDEIVSTGADSIRLDRLGERDVATIRGRRLPLIELGGVLKLSSDVREGKRKLVIVDIGAGSFVLGVDDVLDTEELVIKPAAPIVMATGVYAGQTLPDSGRPMLLIDCAGVAACAGLRFQREAVVEEDAVAIEEAPGMPVLMFLDLDGASRAVPLSIVDRIEPAELSQMQWSGGRMRLTVEESLIPLAMIGEAPTGDFAILRLRDGMGEVAYAIAEPRDIVTVSPELAPPVAPGPVAGVALVEGQPVELLDAHWLFAKHLDGIAADRRPLCLLAGDNADWMSMFLAPMLRAAGYRVTHAPAPGEVADVLIRLGGGSDVEAANDTIPVVRLAADPGSAERDGSVYRYDRAGVLAAIGACTGVWA